MNTLSSDQQRQFGALVASYHPDPDDPAAVEVLMILLEVCHILDLLPAVIEQLFTAAVLRRLRTWNGLVVYAPGRQPSLPQSRRLWVWRPGGGDPQLYTVAANRRLHTGGRTFKPVISARSHKDKSIKDKPK